VAISSSSGSGEGLVANDNERGVVCCDTFILSRT
jgi:hypothetical protein